MLSKNLFEEVLVQPVESGANKLYVVSGYATAAMAFRHLEALKAIKDFNGSPRATVALTHEIMHPTVVSIIDGAKEGIS